jgi:hypothetical protein
VLNYITMAEILDHGQQLDLRTRRGADFAFDVRLFEDEDETIPAVTLVTGSTVIGHIFAPGQPDVLWIGSTDGPTATLTVQVPAGVTRNMQQDWEYTLGLRSAGGQVTALLWGFFRVAQETL